MSGGMNRARDWGSIARPADSKNALSYIKEMLAFASGNLGPPRRGIAGTTFLGIVRDSTAVVRTLRKIAADLRQLSSKPPTVYSEQVKKLQAEVTRIVTQTAQLSATTDALRGVGGAGVTSS